MDTPGFWASYQTFYQFHDYCYTTWDFYENFAHCPRRLPKWFNEIIKLFHKLFNVFAYSVIWYLTSRRFPIRFLNFSYVNKSFSGYFIHFSSSFFYFGTSARTLVHMGPYKNFFVGICHVFPMELLTITTSPIHLWSFYAPLAISNTTWYFCELFLSCCEYYQTFYSFFDPVTD